ncbi:MAG: CHAT domain-containing protein [Cytophagales bacterium]|nr:CHAT domain-containing protein [Cytophagales bacterium]
MLRYRHFDHDFGDSVLYASLILRPDKKQKRPDLVLQANGTELESKFYKAYRNFMRHKLEDYTSYGAYWKPLQKAVLPSQTVYFSADGVYSQINLETIPTAKNKYILDDVNVVLVNNTRSLTERKQRKTGGEALATLYGNPTFYASVSRETVSKERGSNEVIAQLPGTETEIREIEKLLKSQGWKIESYQERLASEGNVKTLQSPKVFHVATHGFFDASDRTQTDLGVGMADNPMLRSGLLFEGAGDLLFQTKQNYNVEPGVLTAFEAMTLNLDNTELVVLSACETGLGDVAAGEGVYGLQRAFLVAGADAIVMSLFKVSDEATQKLMVYFYKNWLEGQDKRAAFINAKKTLRVEYPQPIFWGAFIMIGD